MSKNSQLFAVLCLLFVAGCGRSDSGPPPGAPPAGPAELNVTLDPATEPAGTSSDKAKDTGTSPAQTGEKK